MVKMKIVLTYTLKINTETSHQPIASPQVQISLPVHTQNCSHHCTQLQVLGRSLYLKITVYFNSKNNTTYWCIVSFYQKGALTKNVS